MIMLLCHRLSRTAPLWAAALLGLIAVAPLASATALSDSKAAVASAEKALQRGDWTAFGRAMDALSRISGGTIKR